VRAASVKSSPRCYCVGGAADELPAPCPAHSDKECADAFAPPLPPPGSPPAHCILAQVISTCRELIAQWTPRRSQSGSTEGSPGETRGVKVEPANEGPEAPAIAETAPQVDCPVQVENARELVQEEELRSGSLRAIARDLRRTGRSIGLLPFLVYIARRRARIHVLFGEDIRRHCGRFCSVIGADLPGQGSTAHCCILQVRSFCGRAQRSTASCALSVQTWTSFMGTIGSLQ
jgi:hypothetical protein